jgi:hypothetical protein
MSGERGLNIPIPDPSLLTNEQFIRGQDAQRRDMLAMREFLMGEMNRIEKVHEEKFRGLETRFAESKIEGKTALEAALRAAQNLVDAQNKANAAASEKSESSFTKQIEAVDQQTKTFVAALRSQVDDLKEGLALLGTRITGSEAGSKGAVDNTTKLMAAVTLAVLLIMAAYTLANHGSPQVVAPAVVPVQPSGAR